jgi:hypothetical protein
VKAIALIWSFLIFAGSMHSCIGELAFVQTTGGAYISVFQEDCHTAESSCHKKSEKDNQEDKNCCDFGICSCTLTYISDFQDIDLIMNLPELNEAEIVYIPFQMTTPYTGDIFNPPQTA